MKIAIEGCAHGELEKIYESIQYLEQRENVKIDLLICCGDFQSTRNIADLRCMACPIKYQDIGSFYKYYSGEKVAPILTIFIGGNHEASNYLQELPYGGWVAPNIYYMGYASVINVAGIRIAGISGIYKGHDFLKGHFEMSPYSEDTKRSVYHIRNLEIFRIKQLSGSVDICLSHDWPRGVYHYGDIKRLLKNKPFFKDDIASNKLGSGPCEDVLHYLKPSYWFAAHLHCKFAAVIPHHDDENAVEKTTKFLALDKCLPKRKFLQIVDVDHDESKSIELSYDLEWLTIIYLTNYLLSLKSSYSYMPDRDKQTGRWNFTPTEEERKQTLKKFGNELKIPANFTQTADSYDPMNPKERSCMPPGQTNPQTDEFCEKLGIDDPTRLLLMNSNQLDISSNSSLPPNLTPERESNSTFLDLNISNNSTDLVEDTSPLVKNSMFVPSQVEKRHPEVVKKLSMSLPAPKRLSEVMEDNDKNKSFSSDGELFCIDNEANSFIDSTPIYNKICEDGITETESNKTPPKRFKRRNASMYDTGCD